MESKPVRKNLKSQVGILLNGLKVNLIIPLFLRRFLALVEAGVTRKIEKTTFRAEKISSTDDRLDPVDITHIYQILNFMMAAIIFSFTILLCEIILAKMKIKIAQKRSTTENQNSGMFDQRENQIHPASRNISQP